MSRYTFSLDSYEIKNTRARHEDTNYVAVALSVNNQPIGMPQVKFMGDQNNGTYQVGLGFPDVDVPDGANVLMMYQILNSGNGNRADVEKILGGMVQERMKKADDANTAGSGSSSSNSDSDWKRELEAWAKKYLLAMVFANCDGPITPPAGRQIKWTSAQLKGMAAPGTKKEVTQDEPGNDSATGCGSNSHYIVHCSVAAAAATSNVTHATGTGGQHAVGGQVRDHRTS